MSLVINLGYVQVFLELRKIIQKYFCSILSSVPKQHEQYDVVKANSEGGRVRSRLGMPERSMREDGHHVGRGEECFSFQLCRSPIRRTPDSLARPSLGQMHSRTPETTEGETQGKHNRRKQEEKQVQMEQSREQRASSSTAHAPSS